MKGIKSKEIILKADNKVGELEEIAGAIKDNGINIRAISAWIFEDKAYFRLVVSDHDKAKEILQDFGGVSEKEVVIVDMPDEVGQLFLLASKLKDNNIDLSYLYGTTSESGGKPAIIVFSSDNNEKALKVISA